MLINISEGGRVTLNTTREEAEELGYTEEAIATAEAHGASLKARGVIRARIEKDAGDTLSLLGTTSDASTIAVLVSACFMASLDEGTGYAAFRAKANAFMQAISGDHDPTKIAADFLAVVQSGAIRIPALEKGIVAVLAEVTERGNIVAEAISPSAPQD